MMVWTPKQTRRLRPRYNTPGDIADHGLKLTPNTKASQEIQLLFYFIPYFLTFHHTVYIVLKIYVGTFMASFAFLCCFIVFLFRGLRE